MRGSALKHPSVILTRANNWTVGPPTASRSIRRALTLSIATLLIVQSLTAFASTPVEHIVFRLESPFGFIDSATAIEDALDALGEPWIELGSLTDPFCADPSTVLWVMTGTFPDNYSLSAADGDVLFDHAMSGGSIYFEGSDTWTFDVPTSFALVDGVEQEPGPFATALFFDEMNGLDSGLGLNFDVFQSVVYSWEQPELLTRVLAPSSTDVLGSLISPVWEYSGGQYQTGIAYIGDNGARVVSQSWELGGFIGPQSEVVERLVSFFDGSIEPCYFVLDLQVSSVDCTTGEQILEWTAPPPGSEPLTGYEISRNGVVLATLSPSDTTYLDSSPLVGATTYAVRALCDSSTSSVPREVETFVTAIGAPDNVVLRLDFGVGLVDSATEIETSLENNGETYAEYASTDTIQCIDFDTRLWVVTGTFPDHYSLDDATATYMANHVLGGGSIYLEGTDNWGFGGSGLFAPYDGVAGAAPGIGDVLGLDGRPGLTLDTSGFVDVPYTSDQFGSDELDRLAPSDMDDLGPDAFVIWSEQSVLDYSVAIAYETDVNFGNVISQSWEFGGFTGDRDAVMSLYLGFLGSGTPSVANFTRGDLNSDTLVDVSDAGFGLSALFAGGPFPECLDAADANLDLEFNLSDMLYLLGHLFVGTVAPPAPYPNCEPGSILVGCDTPQCP